MIRPSEIEQYVAEYKPQILRYKEAKDAEWNFGKSKGLGFDRVLIYPTKSFIQFLKDGELTKAVKGKTKDAFDIAKFYVAITRARHSVTIVYDYADEDTFVGGASKYTL